MHKRVSKLRIISDGETSTSALVNHCLSGQIELQNQIVEITKCGVEDIHARRKCSESFLLVRVASPGFLPHLKEIVDSGKPYAYLIDDNFWLLNDSSPLSNFYKNWSVRRTLEAAVSGASIVLCHSHRFRDFLKSFNSNVAVVPAFFDSGCLQGLPDSPPEPEERRIGIVANASKADDLAIIIPAIKTIADQADDDVFFEFCGYIPPALVSHPKIRYFEPIRDYSTFIRMQYMRNWLLGLAPLKETPFSAYKSNNKFREFGGCRTAAIYSDVTVYRESVIDGETGWLVKNCAEAWRERMLEVLGDPLRARQVGANARAEVMAHYDIDPVRNKWLSALSPVLRKGRRSGTPLTRKIQGLARKLHLMGTVSAEGDDLSIATAAGWNRPPAKLRDGFYRNDVLFNLEPGDSLITELAAPVDGAFHWSLLVATFMTTPKGELNVSFSGEGVVPQARRYINDELSDNMPLSIDVELHAGGPVFVRISNETDRGIGFHLLSPNGSTRFESTGASFSGRFLV